MGLAGRDSIQFPPMGKKGPSRNPSPFKGESSERLLVLPVSSRVCKTHSSSRSRSSSPQFFLGPRMRPSQARPSQARPGRRNLSSHFLFKPLARVEIDVVCLPRCICRSRSLLHTQASRGQTIFEGLKVSGGEKESWRMSPEEQNVCLSMEI